MRSLRFQGRSLTGRTSGVTTLIAVFKLKFIVFVVGRLQKSKLAAHCSILYYYWQCLISKRCAVVCNFEISAHQNSSTQRGSANRSCHVGNTKFVYVIGAMKQSNSGPICNYRTILV